MQTTQKPSMSSFANTKSGANEPEPWSLDEQWPALLSGFADQVTEGVSALQNTIDLLLAKGRISKQEHRALSIPADRIKLSGISAQQIHRFYAGRIRQSHEKVGMSDLVESVLQERKKEFTVLGIELRRKLKPVEVLIDPTVAHTFVNAVLDWGLPFGNRVDVRLDLNAWPQHARLQVRVSNDGLPPSSQASADSLSWILVRQIAMAAGKKLRFLQLEHLARDAVLLRVMHGVVDDGSAATEDRRIGRARDRGDVQVERRGHAAIES